MKKPKFLSSMRTTACLKSMLAVVLTLTVCQVSAQSMSVAKYYYEQGKYVEAAKQLRPLADGGNAEAQAMAAKMFFEGMGVQKNDAQGVKYATMAADQCNEDGILLVAKHCLGNMNDDKALSTLLHYTSQHPYLLKGKVGLELASYYLQGVGTAPDTEKAWSIVLGNTYENEFKEKHPKEWKAYQDKHPEEYKIYDVVERMPQFPGGDSAMFKWLSENVPSRYIGDSPGRVVYKFVVRRDGSIDDVKVISNPANMSKTTTGLTIDALMTMPKWIPGRQNGKAVNVYFTLPVTYRD